MVNARSRCIAIARSNIHPARFRRLRANTSAGARRFGITWHREPAAGREERTSLADHRWGEGRRRPQLARSGPRTVERTMHAAAYKPDDVCLVFPLRYSINPQLATNESLSLSLSFLCSQRQFFVYKRALLIHDRFLFDGFTLPHIRCSASLQ